MTIEINAGRRAAIMNFGAAAAGAALLSAGTDRANAATEVLPRAAASLGDLISKLAIAPRRRDFKSVPMILDRSTLWDAAALNEVIIYRTVHKQVWDNTEIGSAWMNLMRNSVNTQQFSFHHPDFLAVSATHGSAHLALYDQSMWDKYKLADMAGAGFKTNTLMVRKNVPTAVADYQDPNSAFGPPGNTIPTLQSRGVVFMACHNAIWEQTAKLRANNINPDKLSHEAMAAELTNHLVDGVVLTPGIVATLAELQQVGFHYAK